MRRQREVSRQAEDGKTRLDLWTEWHDFHALGDSAVCVLTRTPSGTGGEQTTLLCNIEWRFENGRWQVHREQIFLRPPVADAHFRPEACVPPFTNHLGGHSVSR